MPARPLQTLLRHARALAGRSALASPDADLLAAYARTGDEAAFAARRQKYLLY